MRQFWLSRHFALSTQLQVLSLFSDGLGINNFMIVLINCFHMLYEAIAYLYGMSGKYFVELFVRWKMLI